MSAFDPKRTLATDHSSQNFITAPASERPIADNGAATHHALVAGLVETGGAMQHATVVPNHAFAWGPTVRINTRRRRDHQVEFLDQRTALFVIHAFNPLRMIAKKYRLPSGIWMCGHDWMCDWRYLGFLFCRERVLAMAAC